MNRSSGILMPISSLSSPYGIGTIGQAAYDFVDFLNESGQRYWQILPICPTSIGDSPYQSFSTFAGNPYFIDFELFEKEGYINKSDYEDIDWGDSETSVDYDKLYKNRFTVLRLIFNNWIEDNREILSRFIQYNSDWVEDYALFMALKEKHNGDPWWKWKKSYRLRDHEAMDQFHRQNAQEVEFWIFVQCVFYRQWNALKDYAHEKNVQIIGDVPIYVARDSADVWANTNDFWLDKDLNPVKVAGCPPDGFSAVGQLWGNPLYRWEVMKEDGYSWWMRRMEAAANIYDVIRIDHFRGFDSYYAIPAEDPTAEFGEWMDGPGMDFFNVLKEKFGDLEIIAEDLGFLTPSVQKLLEDSGFPGMKVLEFAFDTREESNYLPHTYTKNSVAYIGTHDNDVAIGWLNSIIELDADYCKKYLRLTEEEGYNWGLIKSLMGCVSNLAVVQMQDFLGLGSESRINTPSTVGNNWKWRIEKNALTHELAEKIKGITKLYGRV